MKSSLLAGALALALSCAPAFAQSNPGTSPLSGAKGGTNNGFMQFTGPASSIKTYTLPNASGTVDLLNAIQTFTAAKTFADSTLLLAGSSSGTTTLKATAAASGVLTLPAVTDQLVGRGTTDTLTNKTLTSPVLTTPTLGDATGTSLALNGCSIGVGKFCVAGTSNLLGITSIQGAASALFTAGPNGQTNPTLQLDTSTSSAATGLSIKSAAAGAGVAVSTISSGTNEGVSINAKGTGAIKIGDVSTGGVQIATAGGGLITTGLALSGCSVASNAMCANGVVWISSTSANAFAVGANGLTNPVLTVDASVSSQADGIRIFGNASGVGAGFTVLSPSTNAPSSWNAKGSGIMAIGNVSTGQIQIGGAGGGVSVGSALTYGGVTLSNAVTGTGNMVLSTSPVLTTPNLGTPSALTLTNATGLPIVGLASGSSANLATVITDETGSGALVFGTSPTISAPTVSGLANFSGARRDSTQSAPSQITSNQDNYNPSSVVCSTSSTLLINSDAARNITGIAGGVAGCDLFLINNGAFSITLKDASGSSTAGNRFDLGADFVLAAKATAYLKYDGAASRWRNASGTGGSGGGGGVTQVNSGVGLTGGPVTTTGTISIADDYRQSMLLDRIYLSKATAGYRRAINAFADGYKASDGVNSGSSSNYAVNTTSGYVAPNSTTASSTNPSTSQANVALTMMDRTWSVTNSQTVVSIGAYTAAARTLTMKLFLRNSTGNYDVVVSQSFSHPGGGWADLTLSSPFAVPGSGTYYAGFYAPSGANIDSSATSTARSFKSGDITGTGQTGFTEDAAGTTLASRVTYAPNNMTLVTTTQSTDANVSNGRVLLEYDNTTTPTPNTDLTAEVTCNNGTNWASATLSPVSIFGPNGHKIVETADTGCTAGNTFAVRIKTFNNKLIPIYGAAIAVH